MPAALHVLVLVAAHPKLRSFVILSAWSILSLGLKPSTCALSSVYSLPCDNFVQKLVPQLKKLFVTAFKDSYVSRILFLEKNDRYSTGSSSPGPGQFQIKPYKHCKTVHCAYAYHYILL
jgi:hypothetical protein